MQKLDEAREKLEETNKEFDNARRKAKQAKMAFERYYIFQRYLSSSSGPWIVNFTIILFKNLKWCKIFFLLFKTILNFIIFHSTTTPYGLDLFYGFFWEMCIDEFLSSFFQS